MSLFIVEMGDGSVGVATEDGQILGGQAGVSMKSAPGGPTTLNVEFVVDGKEVKFAGSGKTLQDLKADRYREQEEGVRRVQEMADFPRLDAQSKS
tara:strand:- start:127 stop:411 length:285 start_codon:yes stop_codon:yes gene_type:complete